MMAVGARMPSSAEVVGGEPSYEITYAIERDHTDGRRDPFLDEWIRIEMRRCIVEGIDQMLRGEE